MGAIIHPTLSTLTLHKQHGKEQLTMRYPDEYHANNVDLNSQPLVDSKDRVNFAMLFTLRESRRTPDPALLRVRSRLTTPSPLAPWL